MKKNKTEVQQYDIIDAEYYCEHASCPCREIKCTLKFYDKENIKFFTNRILSCIFCKNKLKIHHENKVPRK